MTLSWVRKWSLPQVLIAYLIEADARPSYEDPTSNEKISQNAKAVIDYANRIGFLNEVFRRPDYEYTTIVLAIQLLLSHIMLDLSDTTLQPMTDMLSFGDSQKAVYSSAEVAPLFFISRGNITVNVKLALHCVNFFKFHLTRETEHTAYEEYSRLAKWRRPQAWQPQANEDVGRLVRKWIGTYGKSTGKSWPAKAPVTNIHILNSLLGAR